MKRFSKIILVFLLVSVLGFNFAFADTVEAQGSADVTVQSEESNEKKSGSPYDFDSSNVDTAKIEEGLENVAAKGESLAYKIVEQISDKSLPVCAILILWGAVLYFILGIRNLYKKRQGLLLMWGAFTFVVIAKIMNFAFWLFIYGVK